MVGDKVLLRCTAFKGKHKIQDCWENTIYEVVEQPFKNMLVIKIKPLGVMTEWRWYIGICYYHSYPNLLIMLVNQIIVGLWPNPKETMGTQVAIAASAITSHVQNLSIYKGVQVTIMIQKGLKFVTTLFWKCWGPLVLSIMGLYNYPYRQGLRVI